MSNESRELYVGQKLVAVMQESGDDTPLATWTYEITSLGPAARGTGAQPSIETRLLSEEWASPQAQEVHSAPAEKAAKGDKGADPAKTALEVTKFVWDFIKDNKAVSNTQATTTSIILKDTDPLSDYQLAREGKSQDVRFYVHDSLIKDWILVDVTTRLDGTYRAVPSHGNMAPGHYLPAVHFDVTKVFVGFSFRLDASAEVAPPSNVGSKNDVVPQARIYAKFKVSWLSSHTHTAAFRANGKHGFSFLGWN